MMRRSAIKKWIGVGLLLLSGILLNSHISPSPKFAAAFYGVIFGACILLTNHKTKNKDNLHQQVRILVEYELIMDQIELDKKQICELLNQNHHLQEQLSQDIQHKICSNSSTMMIYQRLLLGQNMEINELSETFTTLFYSYPEVAHNEPCTIENVYHFFDKLQAHHTVVKEMASKILYRQDSDLKHTQELARGL